MAHKEAFFSYLRGRWQDLFGARLVVLRYDLTSTYFESDPPGYSKRKHGCSRDNGPDCVQVVIALIVTPHSFPIAYEVMAGNTADNTTLPAFVDRIEKQYGTAERIWVMDRGIPTEEVLARMRSAQTPVPHARCDERRLETAAPRDLLETNAPQVVQRRVVGVVDLHQGALASGNGNTFRTAPSVIAGGGCVA